MQSQIIVMSDEELMLAYKQGDKHAFEKLLLKHKTTIYNFLYRFLEQDQNVEEAFQEVFFRVIRSAETYTPTAKSTTWVYTIARNYCIDLSRQGRHRRAVLMEDKNNDEGEGVSWEDRVPDVKCSPDTEVSAFNLAEKLKIALEKINHDQKEVFLLRENQGLAFEEIAHVVGTSVNTVKSRMRYALLALQEEFKKLGITDLK